MSAGSGSLRPFVTVSRSAQLYNTVSYPSGGNIGSLNNATFVATYSSGSTTINAVYVISGQILPGMALSGIGIAAGTYIVGPFSNTGTGVGGIGQYVISIPTTLANSSLTVTSGSYNAAGSVISATSFPQNYPQGPGGIVGPIPGFNCANIMDIRDYYNIPYPPPMPLSSPPIIAVVSFGGGIYGQPVTTGQYAGFWRCSDISGSNGAPINILVAPINGAINAPNADDGGATLENTVDVATVNAFYGMTDPRRDAPIYTPPIIILYIAPSSDISEMYRTFYTVLKNPVVCNGKSYLPSIVTCSWGAPEIAWTQKMPFPPNPSIPVDNDPDPVGIAEINEINDLFAEATKNGINICCASGDIPLTNVNASVNQYNYAQSLLLQGAGGPGNPGQVAAPQVSVFPLTSAARASLPPPQVIFPASSPYVTCVGGSAVYFPTINVGSYSNPAEFAWARGNGGISSVFTIPPYQQNLPGAASTSAAQFLASSLNTANLAVAALGSPSPNGGYIFPDPISGGITAPNTAVTLATQTKNDVYNNTLAAFNAAVAALQDAQGSAMDDALSNTLIQTVKDASTALATAKASRDLANDSLEKAQDLLVKTQTVSSLLINAGTTIGAAAAATGSGNQSGAAYVTQQAVLSAQYNAQQAAYQQLVYPSTSNSVALQMANQALQVAQAVANASALSAVTLPAAVGPTTEVANKAVDQAASAIVAPSLSSHPYLQAEPIRSPLVPVSNLAYDAAQVVAGSIPYNANSETAPSYLLTTLGLGYKTVGNSDPSGNSIISVQTQLNNAVTRADNLVAALDNSTTYYDSSGNAVTVPPPTIGPVAIITNAAIKTAVGQLDASGSLGANGSYLIQAGQWKDRANYAEMLPAAAFPRLSTSASAVAITAISLAQSGAANISNYASGASGSSIPGYNLPCGLASTSASALAAVFPVTSSELQADRDSGYAFGSTDVGGGVDSAGTFTGITTPLINLRNIYANTTLATRRTITAVKAAKDSRDAFFAWAAANEKVNELRTEATNLYGLVPGPSMNAVREMDAKLVDAKTKLSAATYVLGVTENYAVTTARLAQQSAASTSVLMGNWIDSSGGLNIKFDQLGNLMAVSNSVPAGTGQPSIVAAEGINNANCPIIALIDSSGSINAKNALRAAQAMALAAANDNYLTTSVTTWNVNGINGVDSSGNQTASLTGTRLLVQDAQYAAAGAAAQVANVAFADATESLARFTDWHSISLAANAANAATVLVYSALTDASGGGMSRDASGNSKLVQAINAITNTVTLLVAASTPYNQQSTPSATIATNDVVVLAAKLEHAKNVAVAAQTAIQLAASTYDASGNGSNISGQPGQGGSIFTVNMAYAKVTADAVQAACTAAAILAREEAVLAARRANYSALALKKLVGDSVIGEAIASFLDQSGNLVQQTGYDSSRPLRKTVANNTTTNGFKPPSVTASTVLYQGSGGLNYSNAGLGALQAVSNPQPSVISNLTYTTSNYSDIYSATSGFVTAAQAVITALEADSSGNTSQLANDIVPFLTYPNVNAVNALNSTIGSTDASGNPGVARAALNNCLRAAYEAQQWVVASANASFVTFGSSPANVNLVSFTPSLLGVVNKLASDADACLQTVLTAQASIIYALSLRNNRVLLHDVDAANFAAVINANQAAADTYLALKNAAIKHEANTLNAFHLGDLTNSLSPLTATAATAAGQAAALGGMAFSAPMPNSNFASTQALANASFPNAASTTQNFAAAGWNSVSMTSNNGFNAAFQMNNSQNPNYGPYNGTATGAAPYPALNSSSSSRITAPAAPTLQASAQDLQRNLSRTALATSKAAADSTQSILDFNNLMVDVSTITPSLVDAATSASNLTLSAAKLANYATSLQTQGQIYPNQASINSTANLLEQEFAAILAARESADANLDAITPSDARYKSRLNMLNLWDIAINAAKAAVAASANAPTNFPAGSNPALIVPASLGTISVMGTTNSSNWAGIPALSANSAPYYYVKEGSYTLGTMDTVIYGPNNSVVSTSQPSLLGQLNAAVINAYNATTGSPTGDSSGNYRYIRFLDNSGNVVTNFPENVNDTNQAYNNAVAALRANTAVGNASVAALQNAALKINAAYLAAVQAAQSAPALPGTLPSNISSPLSSLATSTGLTQAQVASQVAVAFWNSANLLVSNMLYTSGAPGLLASYTNLNLQKVFNLMAVVGLNFTNIVPLDTSSYQQSIASAANVKQVAMKSQWANGQAATWSGYTPTGGASLSSGSATILSAIGLGAYSGIDFLSSAGIASGTFNGSSPTPTGWGAYYWTLGISVPNQEASGIALQAATDAWNSVQSLLNTFVNNISFLDAGAANANRAKASALYSVKIALQAAARAAAAGKASADATNALATATNSYDDLAAFAAAEASYASTANLNMYRCVPDIAMHANADDLPIIFRLNGSAVYVGGTSIAASMFAGFLGVVQSQTPINYFVNPIMYDNYTFPSPLFNDISGSSQVWYTGSVGGPTIPPRIANILPGVSAPTSGLGSGLYNLNVGLGSINGANLSALMEVPHLVKTIMPAQGPSASVTVYPGTTSTITVYVEPVSAYNPFVKWSCNSLNAAVSQTDGPILSNNGMNDTQPYTEYNPLLYDASGYTVVNTPSIGNYALGSVGNAVIGINPYSGNSCVVFSATVTGVTALSSSAPLPIITVSSTDGSNVYGSFRVSVLPAVQVTGVSISLEDRMHNPANITLFLGKKQQLLVNVTPLNATNQRVFWWSSNSSIVNVDVSGLLTSLAPGQVIIKATSLNNNISASISVYVPTPITGLDVLPRSITLNPNMLAHPLKNSALIRAIIQPENADYKRLTWEVLSSTQQQPAPVGITDVISLPRNGTILARDSSGDITDNTQATVTAVSNGTAVIRVSTYGDPYGVYGTYTATITVNVVTPITQIVMTQSDMVINLSPETATNTVLPESYNVTATFRPAYPSIMNVFWTSSNPKVAVVSNNSKPILNTTVSDPDFGLWQITETVSPLSNGTTVIKVTTADGQHCSMTTVVVTTPVTGLSISALPIVLNPSRQYTLQATVLPPTATNKAIYWESTNTSIATVDSNGVVNAITSGSCGISATTVDGDYSAISQISVVTPLVGVQLLVNTPLPIHVNDVVQILVVMVPTIATNQLFTWTVTDGPSGPIFTTGPPQNGNIVFLDAVQSGNAVFTVTSADGNKQASINLQVVNW